MNNYLIHLSHEMHDIFARVQLASQTAGNEERQWKEVKAVRKTVEHLLEKLRNSENEAKEAFRQSHATHSTLRTQQGEIEEEFFRNGEEADDWFQH